MSETKSTRDRSSVREEKEPRQYQHQEDATVEECLDILLYNDDQQRPLTLNSLYSLVVRKRMIVGPAGLFIKGIRQFDRDKASFKCFAQAEKEGCDHPILHYFLGECYRLGDKGVNKDTSRALEYYDKAIKGGCSGAYRSISLIYEDRLKVDKTSLDREGAFNYLIELEMSGNVSGCVLAELGKKYYHPVRYSFDPSTAIDYYQRAIDVGYAPVFSYTNPFTRYRPGDEERIILSLLEADKKGMSMKDDRWLSLVIDHIRMTRRKPGVEVARTFATTCEMVVHYCDILISRGSSLGYYQKASLYRYGYESIAQDKAKAVSMWEEADRLGLANRDVYIDLALSYKYGNGAPVNTSKMVEYSKKALLCHHKAHPTVDGTLRHIKTLSRQLDPSSASQDDDDSQDDDENEVERYYEEARQLFKHFR